MTRPKSQRRSKKSSLYTSLSRIPLSKRQQSQQASHKKRRRTLRTPPTTTTMEVIGKGKDGYILSLPPPSNTVIKLHNTKMYPMELMQRIKEIENADNFFNIEERMDAIPQIPSNILRESGMKAPYLVTSMVRLEQIPNTKNLTRAQYRHLRDGIQLLHKHGIAHGDIIDNVMLHPADHQPRIIDWNNAVLHATDTDKNIDMNAFYQFYKIGK
jgi:tRNA A-37 threonylcarbamoyl transferase component Bud32